MYNNWKMRCASFDGFVIKRSFIGFGKHWQVNRQNMQKSQ